MKRKDKFLASMKWAAGWFIFFSFTATAETQNTLSLTTTKFFIGNSDDYSIGTTSGTYGTAGGTLSETYSGIAKALISTTTGRFSGNSLEGTSTYGISFGSFFFFRGFLTPAYYTVVNSASVCPSATTYNFLNLRFRSANASRGPMDATSSSLSAGGYLTFDSTDTHPFTITKTFNLSGPSFNNASVATYDGYSSTSCSQGRLRVQATSTANDPLEEFGTYLFGDHSFVYYSAGGNPLSVLGLTQETLSSGTMTGLKDHVFSGLYTNYQLSSVQVRKSIYLYPDSAGTTFTLYEVDDVNDPTSKTSLGTLTCTSLNSPANGFCSGTISISGMSGTGSAVCMLSTATPEHLLACAAQQPGSNSNAISIIAHVPVKSLLSITLSNSTPTAAPSGSTSVTATLKNLSGRAIATIGNPSNAGLRLSAPFSNSGAYAGGGGSLCSTSLAGFQTCTVSITYAPTAVGTSKQIFRAAYDDGYFGTVNATATLTGVSGLSSVAVTPSTASYQAGSSIQYTATATYTNGATQDVTNAVTWSSSNAFATVNSTGTVSFIGGGSVSIQAELAGASGNRTVSQTGGTIQVLGQTSATGLDGATTGLSGPEYSCVDSNGNLFVSDTSNNRVLIWTAVPDASDTAPDFVLGQSDFTGKTANSGGVSASTLSAPRGIDCDGTNLLVADTGNNRVLVWTSVPTSTQQAADLVLGQPDFTTVVSDTTAAKMKSPRGVAISGSTIYAADTGNHRVLVWTSFPSGSGTSANYALGQTNLTNGSANRGGSVADNTLSSPYSVSADGSNLWVADYGNNRVLKWTSAISAHGQSANRVLGQSNMTSSTANSGGISGQTLSSPAGVRSDGTRLFVADSANSRVLMWTSLPTSNQQVATYVLGQSNMTSSTVNSGGISGQSLNLSMGVYSDGTKVYVGDTTNNRLLMFSTMPSANFATADIVLGQTGMTSNAANNSVTPSAQSFSSPHGIHSDGTKLYVADTSNNRVLIWNTMPTSNKQAADVVLGQPDMTSTTANNGGISASRLSGPLGVFSDGTKLYVADTGNHRVLIWNTIPTSSGTAANVVVGQPNMTSNTSNNGGRSATSLRSPSGVSVFSSKLYIADTSNHRVLIYNTIPTSNQPSANVALGQANFTSGSANRGGSAAANTLRSPYSMAFTGTNMFVADMNNNRVLQWTTLPTSTGTAATYAIGQPNLTTSSNGLTSQKMNKPRGVYTDGTKVFVAEYGNNRVIVFGSIPSASSPVGTYLIGQNNFTEKTANNGGISAYALFRATSVYADGTNVWTVDYSNSRVLVTPYAAHVTISDGPTYDYGFIALNGSVDKTFTVTNSGLVNGSSAGAGTPAISAPYTFKGGSYPGTTGTCGATLTAQKTCTIVINANPTSEAAIFSDIVRITYNDGSNTEMAAVGITSSVYTAGAITFTDGASYNYGTVASGATSSHTFTVSNASGVTISQLKEGSTDFPAEYNYKGGNYPGTGGTCGTVLKTGTTCTIVLDFSPVSAGTFNGTLSLQYYDGTQTQQLTITLNGAGS